MVFPAAVLPITVEFPLSINCKNLYPLNWQIKFDFIKITKNLDSFIYEKLKSANLVTNK